MADTRRPLVAGNWKMNGLRAAASKLTRVIEGFDDSLRERVDLVVCPPATLVLAFAGMARGSSVEIGGQDCHAQESGAHTGDLSAEMLADAGAKFVIVGHSERRADHGESDPAVRAKAAAGARAGLAAIVCVGETREEREAGATLGVVGGQLDGSLAEALPDTGLVVAYEPVWAIGTGLTPTLEDIAQVHGFIRERLAARYGEAGDALRILYGGSVKPSNATEILRVDNVDGALVGGASLKADDFLAIAAAYR